MSTPAMVTPDQSRVRGTPIAVVVVCWLLVVFDGYDLIVYGTVIPSLQAEWGISAATAGTLGSLTLFGMMVGALLAGRLADAIGRRRVIIGCAVTLSVFTALCALATGPVLFGGFRLLAGLGLGGLVPAANAIAAEVVPVRWRKSVSTMLMSGVPIGGVLAATFGISVIPRWGWQPMFAVALLPLAALVPVAWKVLPDNAFHSRHRAESGFGGLFGARFRVISVVFALATMTTLLAWYGLGTWLPKVMQSAGTDLGGALTFAVALNTGAAAGSLLTAWAGARFGVIEVGATAAAVAGLALLAMLGGPPVALAYAGFVLAGIGTHGTQCLIIAAVASLYPDQLRGTALGWTLGVGRIGAVAAPQLGGWLLTAGFGAQSNFLLFGVCALAASALLAAVAVSYRRAGSESQRAPMPGTD
ncbi:MFS transporter [Nocardia brasiliensis]|uniref:MFS transporter n=1 Tax=Nocardia brasiliensis TaxID=37326 RepID=UPI0018932E8E|nr:MFS transporter [Nocardia brasiliensis]